MNKNDLENIKYKRLRNPLVAAADFGYDVKQISQDPNCFVTGNHKIKKVVIEETPGTPFFPINNAGPVKIARDKNLTKKLLGLSGLKLARGKKIRSRRDFDELMDSGKLSYPLVIKPLIGTCGIGVMANLETPDECYQAIDAILKNPSCISFSQKRFLEPILVEEFFSGNDFRFLVLDGKVIAVLERILPYIEGNGKDPARKLILERLNRKNQGLKIDNEIKKTLRREKVGLEDIIPAGKTIVIRYNANISTGGIGKDMTGKQCDFFEKVAVKATSALGLRYAGVDILTMDITQERDYRIIEVNGNADHSIHFNPDFGKGIDVSGNIIKAMFKD